MSTQIKKQTKVEQIIHVKYMFHISLHSEDISSRVESGHYFVVDAELAVQSQQRRWDDGTRHPQLQPALSSAGTDEWVLSWRLNEASDSSGDRRAVGYSRF